MEGGKERQLVYDLGLESMDQLADAVDQLKSDMNLPPGLSSLGIGETDIPILVENGFRPDRVGNNPRSLTTGELTDLLLRAI
jgi:alcohol dehydrogenase class IV